MQNLMPLVFVAAVVVVIGGFIYSQIQARKRREGLFELAARLNLNFCPEEDRDVPEQFNFLNQFKQGDNRYAINIISGNYQQQKVQAFDYHYQTYYTDKNGTHTEHHWLSFCILTLPAVMFPDLTIRREGFFTKLAEVFGYQDINFESAEFSKAFNVRSPDKKFAYDVCNARMIEYLLANRDVSLEIEDEVIALAFNSRISVEQFELNLQRLVEIRARLPEYLFTQST
jgi:hypothetical protein